MRTEHLPMKVIFFEEVEDGRPSTGAAVFQVAFVVIKVWR